MQNESLFSTGLRRIGRVDLPAWLLRLFWVAAASAIFALAYSQSPLYTSNQNQYFLHGLARAGLGSLNEDWLANTLDPTPVFSFLVEVTYRLFQSGLPFYLYYAALMGIYLFSLIQIAGRYFDIHSTRARFVVYFALLVALHSAALRFALSQSLGYNFGYIFEDGLADQRMLGPVFQPSSFGVLLVFSVYLFLCGRPKAAVLSAVLAATVHPTYLLSAALLVFSYLLITLASSFPRLAGWRTAALAPGSRWTHLRQALLIGLLALVAVAPILLYVYTNFGSTPAETSAQAQDILVNYRIPHHAQIGWWLDITALFKIAWVALAITLVARQRIAAILLAPGLIAAALTLLQALTGSLTLALVFPWRVSVLLVPLATALILAWGVSSFFEDFPLFVRRYNGAITRLGQALLVAVVSVGVIRFVLDVDRKVSSTEREMTGFVAGHLQSSQVYLTPIKLQDFRLASGAPVYVEFKSIPYRDQDVLEWYRRVQLADTFYLRGDCSLLPEFQGEGVTHVILSAEKSPQPCPGLDILYQNADFQVARLLER